MKDNTKRFSNRVDDYVKYRPSYPNEITKYILSEKFNLTNTSVAADVGSGTGIFTEILLKSINTVYSVEPNDEMRNEAEKRLGKFSGYFSVSGSAESTNLKSCSIDFITVAQAFHWFDLGKTKEEFKRILKSNATIFLIWNKRRIDTDFLDEYEKIIQAKIPEYKEVNHHNITQDILKQFLDKDFSRTEFKYNQAFDFEGVIGRLRSSSYCPKPGTKLYTEIEGEMKRNFDRNSINGKASFNYDTEVYSGKFA